MRAVKRKITDMTVDELKDVIHEAIAEDMEFGGRPSRSWRTASWWDRSGRRIWTGQPAKKAPLSPGMIWKMHKIILHRNAVKFYRKADNALKERVADAFDVIARNPHLDGHIKKLKGEPQTHASFPHGRSACPLGDRRCAKDCVGQDHRMERSGIQIKVHPFNACFFL